MDANTALALLPPRYQGRLTPLSGGFTNLCWRLDTPQQPYWLRLGSAATSSLGINRHQELRAHQAAARVGLAPPVRHADPDHGLLLLDWLPEPNWQTRPATPDLRLLMRKVAHLHQLQVPLAERDLAAHAAHYLSQLQPIAPELAAWIGCFNQPELNLAYRPVFCHQDLNAANLLGPRPWLLDWEYAAYCDAAFELAVIADSFQLSHLAARRVLADYNAAGGQVSWSRFQARRPWVQWLTALWAALQYQHSAAPCYLTMQDQALAKLAQMLAEHSSHFAISRQQRSQNGPLYS